MRIAITGIRGIPGRYGGFETFVEHLAPALVDAGHEVLVVNRPRYRPSAATYKGVDIVTLPTIHNKFLDTFVHTWLALMFITARRNPVDVVLVCNVGNSPVAWLPRIRGIPVVVNVDGLEWQRQKWPVLAKWYLRHCEWVVTHTATRVVTDARVVQRYYAEHFGCDSTMIPYGAMAETSSYPSDYESLRMMGLESGNYFLYVSRLEPENNAVMVIEAFQQAARDLHGIKLALVGDAPYGDRYKEGLYKLVQHDDRILMPGGVYGDGYHLLQRHALAYIHATSVGGTHPALIEAMAHGNIILLYHTPENVEAAGDTALRFTDGESLASLLVQVAENPTAFADYRKVAADRAERVYSWPAVTKQYEALLRAVTGAKIRPIENATDQSESHGEIAVVGEPPHE